MDTKNVYTRLQEARIRLQSTAIKASGNNTFAKYTYLTLEDFLPVINSICNEIGLCGVVCFGQEEATLTIVNTDKPDEKIVFASPMSSAELKGCHQVQNLGAVQSYLRRYLWMAAFEIVEHDALDATTGNKELEPKAKQEADYVASLVGANSIAELKTAWTKIPQQYRTACEKAKDARKLQLEQTTT